MRRHFYINGCSRSSPHLDEVTCEGEHRVPHKREVARGGQVRAGEPGSRAPGSSDLSRIPYFLLMSSRASEIQGT